MNSNVYQDEEISLKELILKVREYFVECKKNWLLILLFTLPFLVYQLYRRFVLPTYFPATLTFMINDSKSSSVGGLIGQFRGLVGEDEDKLDKILELAKSRRTIANSLTQKISIRGKLDFAGNHFINIQKLHNEWAEDTLIGGFYFTRNSIDSFGLQENRALYSIHKVLIGSEKTDPLFSTSSNRKTGIMSFALKTNNEELTLKLIKTIFSSLSNFYIESTIRKEKETYEVLVSKKDSIEKMLFRNDIATAQHDDQSNNLLLQLDKVPAKRYSRNNQVLTVLYTEILKNTELAEFALKTATPFITAIDEPIPPLKPVKYGRLKEIVYFVMIGIFSGCAFVILRSIFKKTMAGT